LEYGYDNDGFKKDDVSMMTRGAKSCAAQVG